MQDRLKITLRRARYKQLVTGFTHWLQTIGYAQSTVYGFPRMAKELLCWLEQANMTDIKQVKKEQVQAFMDYFKNRPNMRTAGGLSISHINKQADAIEKFFTYLRQSGQCELKPGLQKEKDEQIKQRTVLSKAEIQTLYAASDNTPIGIRDRAMLAVYYGCGLRKSEGIELEVSDVLFERRLLYVRKAKNKHERYVPISTKCLQDLEAYIYTARPLLLNAVTKSEALFISERGRALTKESMAVRLKALKEKTNDPEIQHKNFGLHALRHSIATHLMQAGMDIENIALFLGHKTLDSTQLYTHIVNEMD